MQSEMESNSERSKRKFDDGADLVHYDPSLFADNVPQSRNASPLELGAVTPILFPLPVNVGGSSTASTDPPEYIRLGNLGWINRRSKFDEILLCTKTTGYHDITADLDKTQKFICLQGGPGVGKTVTTWNYVLAVQKRRNEAGEQKDAIWISIVNHCLIHLRSDGNALNTILSRSCGDFEERSLPCCVSDCCRRCDL
jgi:hypothetical protein